MEKPKVRRPVVAGKFYPASPSELKKDIGSFVDKKAEKGNALGCMLPHAGYMYSGEVAAQTLSRINLRDKIILLGPNHTGYGEPFSIMTEGTWQTPLGEVRISSTLAKKILKGSQYLKEDAEAHLQEHSLEVELPLLQYFKTDFEIVPIAFLSDGLDSLKACGGEIAKTLKDEKLENSVLLVASSDMTHYESEKDARAKDNEAIEAILELNEDKLAAKIKQLNITMCGYAPVIVMLACAKQLGAKSARLVSYRTSGDITGDRDSVVGYAGVIISQR